jgi:hypothetical protein
VEGGVTNYASAAARHWSDAEHLFDALRLDNADQLFGFAAECALKTVLFAELAPDAGGELPKGYYVHIDELWDRVSNASLRKRYPTVHALLKLPNPFSNWCVDQRYGESESVVKDQVEVHRKMAQRLLGAAQLHGIRSKD